MVAERYGTMPFPSYFQKYFFECGKTGGKTAGFLQYSGDLFPANLICRLTSEYWSSAAMANRKLRLTELYPFFAQSFPNAEARKFTMRVRGSLLNLDNWIPVRWGYSAFTRMRRPPVRERACRKAATVRWDSGPGTTSGTTGNTAWKPAITLAINIRFNSPPPLQSYSFPVRISIQIQYSTSCPTDVQQNRPVIGVFFGLFFLFLSYML